MSDTTQHHPPQQQPQGRNSGRNSGLSSDLQQIDARETQGGAGVQFVSRLGFKIVGAMLVVAVIPLVVSSVLVGQIIRVSDSVVAGQTRSLTRPLERSAAAYRALVASRKHAFVLQARLLATDEPLNHAVDRAVARSNARASRAASYLAVDDHPTTPINGKRIRQRLDRLVKQHPEVIKLRVIDTDGRVVAQTRAARTVVAEYHRTYNVRTALRNASAALEVSFAASLEPMRDLRALGTAQHEVAQISGLRGELATWYRVAFLIMFGCALLVATGLSWLIARQTVRRVGTLVAATRRVADGDLDTRVQVGGRDELGELASSFNEMVAELRNSRERIAYLQRIGAWQDVARRLAHQIKNPLTPIQLALQQLRSRSGGQDPQLKQLIEEVHEIVSEEVGVLRRLVEAFSSFARLPRVQPTPVDLNALVDDFLKSHVELADQASLQWHPLPRPCPVMVDTMLIKQVLYNLVSNAVEVAADAQPAADLTVTIKAREVRSSTHVALSVQDNGPGMDQETMERAFDPYFTRRANGSGLGLAIVKKIVFEHRGSITVRSTPGAGAEFIILLPTAHVRRTG